MIRNILVVPAGSGSGRGKYVSMFLQLSTNQRRAYEYIYVQVKFRVLNQGKLSNRERECNRIYIHIHIYTYIYIYISSLWTQYNMTNECFLVIFRIFFFNSRGLVWKKLFLGYRGPYLFRWSQRFVKGFPCKWRVDRWSPIGGYFYYQVLPLVN